MRQGAVFATNPYNTPSEVSRGSRVDHGDGSRDPLFVMWIVSRSFLDNSSLSIPAYHIDAARQLLPSAHGSGTSEHTSARQVVDGVGAGAIVHTMRPFCQLVDASIVTKITQWAEHPLPMGRRIGVGRV